jgi:hypothetical protein
MDQHIETYCMMKEDKRYDASDVLREHLNHIHIAASNDN